MYQETAKKNWATFYGVFPQIMDDKLDPWCFSGTFQEMRINPHFLKTPLHLLATRVWLEILPLDGGLQHVLCITVLNTLLISP